MNLTRRGFMSRYLLPQAMPVAPVARSEKTDLHIRQLELWHRMYNIDNLKDIAAKFSELVGLRYSFARNNMWWDDNKRLQYVWCLEWESGVFFVKIDKRGTYFEALNPSTECVRSFIRHIYVKIRRPVAVKRLKDRSTK